MIIQQPKSKSKICAYKQVVFQKSQFIDPIQQVQILQYHKYDSIFNFFLSKPINDICDQINIYETILIKQFEYFHNQNEYLRRYYEADETGERIKLLGSRQLLMKDLYSQQKILKTQEPRLKCFGVKNYLNKRKKRKAKIQKKLRQIQLQIHEQFESQFLKEDQVSFQSKSQIFQIKNNVSFQSSCYNIYQDFNRQQYSYHKKSASQYINSPFSHFAENQYEIQQEQQKNIKNLIWDFDQLDNIKVLNDYNKLKQKQKNKINKPKFQFSAKSKFKLNVQQYKKTQQNKKTKYFGNKIQNQIYCNNGFKTYRTTNPTVLEFTGLISPKLKQKSSFQINKQTSIDRIKYNYHQKINQSPTNSNRFNNFTEKYEHQSYQDLKFFKNSTNHLSRARQNNKEQKLQFNSPFEQRHYSSIIYKSRQSNLIQYRPNNNKPQSPQSLKIRQKAIELINEQKVKIPYNTYSNTNLQFIQTKYKFKN